MIIKTHNRLFAVSILLLFPVLTDAQTVTDISEIQVKEWEELKYGMFIHFNMNTFAGAEYDTGKMPAGSFNTVFISEPYNPHIQAAEFQYLEGEEWKTLIKGTQVGLEFTKQFPAVESRMVRLVITRFKTGENPFNVISFPGAAYPVEGATISEFQVY